MDSQIDIIMSRRLSEMEDRITKLEKEKAELKADVYTLEEKMTDVMAAIISNDDREAFFKVCRGVLMDKALTRLGTNWLRSLALIVGATGCATVTELKSWNVSDRNS